MLGCRELCEAAIEQMKPEEIDHHGNGNGLDDLYLKVTPVSKQLIEQYEFKNNVSTFVDAIDHVLWYDVPFAWCYIEEPDPLPERSKT